MKISQFVLSLILFIVSLTMNSFEQVTPDPNSRWPFNVHETSPNLGPWSLLPFQKPHLAASGRGHTSLTLGKDPAWQAAHLQFLWTTWRNQPETGSPRGRQPRLGREETQSVNTTLFLTVESFQVNWCGISIACPYIALEYLIIQRDIMVYWSWNPKDQNKILAPTTYHTLGNLHNFSGPPDSPHL